ncbi:hypothetical protein MRB53_004668 [Persea americana]|uniref:Uncharacterized protein n=1 Tax=Persea americana TaxID=3435 RepID=A0ACC2MBU5_PERAE|nr:hypothetical protein MRB53_004668 [Persea americana]
MASTTTCCPQHRCGVSRTQIAVLLSRPRDSPAAATTIHRLPRHAASATMKVAYISISGDETRTENRRQQERRSSSMAPFSGLLLRSGEPHNT